MDPIISLKNASVIYGKGTDNEVRAVDGVSFDIFPEEYVIFFGPSGCGKSTMMYTIAGLEKLTSGEITVAGKQVAHLPEDDIVDFHRETIGMVFQAYYLIPSLRVLQNVALPQIFLSAGVKDRESRARSLLKRFGIGEQKDKYPNQLSGGQQQRVAIARSLVNNPPILLADEPVGNLDSKSAEDVLILLQELNKQDKKTIILVTHNPNHLKFAQRVLYMKDGKIIREVRNEEQETVEQKQRHEQEDSGNPRINFGLRQLAKVFPNADQEVLKRKMLTSYLLDDLDVQAGQRLEEIVGEFMRGKIDRKKFISIATTSLRTNGIGLYTSHAERLADKLVHATGLANFLLRNFKEFPRTYEEYQRILNQISEFIVRELELNLEEGERMLFDQAVKARLEGSITHDGFQDMLDRPEKEGGAGFNVRTAHNVSRLMEILLIHFDEIESEKKKEEEGNNNRPHLFGLRVGVRASEDGNDSKNTDVQKEAVEEKQSVTISRKSLGTFSEAFEKSSSEKGADTSENKTQKFEHLKSFSELQERQKDHAFSEEKEREAQKTIEIQSLSERRSFTPPVVKRTVLPARTARKISAPKKRSWLQRIFVPNPQPKSSLSKKELVIETPLQNKSSESTRIQDPQNLEDTPKAPIMHSMKDDRTAFDKASAQPIKPQESFSESIEHTKSRETFAKPDKSTKHTAHEIRRLLERGEIRSAGTNRKPSGIIFPEKIKHDN